MTDLLLALLLAQGSTAPAAAPPPDRASPDQVICRRQQVLGSRLRYRRVCMTEREWQAQHSALTRRVQEFGDRSSWTGGVVSKQ
jgi:hypothetical protein